MPVSYENLYDDPVQRQILQEWQWYRYSCLQNGTPVSSYSEWLERRSSTLDTTRMAPTPKPDISKTTRVDSLEPEQGDHKALETETGLTLRIADHCRHFIHPGNKQASVIICCTCQVNFVLQELNSLSTVWARNGGPNAHYEQRHNNYYQKVLRAWHGQKLRLIKTIRHLEATAEQERAWDIENPGVLDSCQEDVQCSEAVLNHVRKETPFLHWLDTDAAPQTPRPSLDKKRKTLSWSEAVVESPQRPHKDFKRGHYGYKPGRWASQDGEVFLNTSFYKVEDFGNPEHERQLDELWDIDNPTQNIQVQDDALHPGNRKRLTQSGKQNRYQLRNLEGPVGEGVLGCTLFLVMLIIFGVWLAKKMDLWTGASRTHFDPSQRRILRGDSEDEIGA